MKFFILPPKTEPILNHVSMAPEHLAKRWGITTRTLTRWRHEGRGPTYCVILGRHHNVMYRVADIKLFESVYMGRK